MTVGRGGKGTGTKVGELSDQQIAALIKAVRAGGPKKRKPPLSDRMIHAGGRAAWRWRRQLAPLYACVGLRIAAGVLHGVTWHASRTVLLVAVVAAAGVWLFGREWLDRPVERVYAAWCLLAAGSWLAWAATTGGGGAAVAVLVAVGGLTAVPWWAHYRRRPRKPSSAAVVPAVPVTAVVPGSPEAAVMTVLGAVFAEFKVAANVPGLLVGP